MLSVTATKTPLIDHAACVVLQQNTTTGYQYTKHCKCWNGYSAIPPATQLGLHYPDPGLRYYQLQNDQVESYDRAVFEIHAPISFTGHVS
jgi:hypothetical protein